MCVPTLCFFGGVSELKCSFMEENKLHVYSPLLPTNEVHGGGRNPLPWSFWVLKVHAGGIKCKKRTRGCLSCPHADRRG